MYFFARRPQRTRPLRSWTSPNHHVHTMAMGRSQHGYCRMQASKFCTRPTFFGLRSTPKWSLSRVASDRVPCGAAMTNPWWYCAEGLAEPELLKDQSTFAPLNIRAQNPAWQLTIACRLPLHRLSGVSHGLVVHTEEQLVSAAAYRVRALVSAAAYLGAIHSARDQ